MSWLKRIEPVILHQSSEIPYVVLEDGAFMCFSNFYSEKPDTSDYHISFKVDKSKLMRKSTNYFAFKRFPTTIPFEDIQFLDSTVIEGSIIKSASEIVGDSKDILVIKSTCLNKMSESEFQEFVDIMDDCNNNFLLVGNNLHPRARLIDDMVTTIHHIGWMRTAVSIAHHICDRPDRKYCWTKSIPEINIQCHGFKTVDEMDKFRRALDRIGIEQSNTSWE